ncbi:MAG: tetratricopeptide repeat protein [Planctomycetota bacterium]
MKQDSQKIQRFGNYQILKKLGQGAMGAVYHVKDSQLQKEYALKLMLAQGSDTPQDRIRFQQEARITARLKHPNIVQVVDFGEEKGKLYFVMELIQGCSLKDYFLQPHEIQEKIQVFEKILNALHYAHTEGIIHRDLKPANIFMTPDGEPKIGDFGLAKDFQSASLNLTKSGEILGTPAYMAPEQISGQTDSFRSTTDVYAVGVCLYEALTQQLPLNGATIPELVYKVCLEEPLPPSSLKKEIHPDLDSILLKALEKSQEYRYSSAEAFADDLRHFLAGEPISIRSFSFQERSFKWYRRNRLSFWICFILLLFFVLLWSFYRWQEMQQIQSRFKNHLQSAQKKMARYELQGEDSFSKKNALLLEALNEANEALILIPENFAGEQQKSEIAIQLIRLSCRHQEYLLAEYVVRDLKNLKYFPELSSQLKLEEIEPSERQNEKQFQEEFQQWIHFLKKGRRKKEFHQEAIFRITKMQTPLILNELLQILEESREYFLQKERPQHLSEFYETIVKSMGHFESEKMNAILFKIIQEVGADLKQTPPQNRLMDQLNYLIAVIQTSSQNKITQAAEAIGNLRLEIGNHGQFWDRTLVYMRKLLPMVKKEGLPVYEENELLSTYKAYISGNWQESLDSIEEFLKKNPTDSDAYNKRGLLFYTTQNYRRALDDFSRAIELNPQESSPYNHRALTKVQLEDLEGALEDYEKALQLSPDCFAYYINRSQVYLLQKQWKKALEDSNSALKIDPQAADVYQQRGLIYSTLGQASDALSDYNCALSIDPQASGVYLNRGNLRSVFGDFQGALHDFNEVIRLSPKMALAYLRRGNIKRSLEDWEGALIDYQQGIDLKPTEAEDFYFLRGNLLFDLKRFAEAIQEYDVVLKLKPDHLIAYLNRGRSKHALGQYLLALKDYETLLKRSPENLDAIFFQSVIQMELGNLDQSITSIEAYVPSPGRPHMLDFFLETLFKRASLSFQKKNILQAETDLLKIQKLAPPGFPHLKEVQWLLDQIQKAKEAAQKQK